MRRFRTPAGSRTLRALSSQITFWIAAAVVAFLFVDAVVRAGAEAWRWMPPALLVLWALWLVLVHSSVRLERDRVVVRNALRTHEVPWSEVAAVIPGPQLYLETTGGRRIACLGAPFPRRPGRDRPGRERVRDPQEEFADALESARHAATPNDRGAGAGAGAVRPRWEPLPIVIGAVLIAATILVFTLLPR